MALGVFVFVLCLAAVVPSHAKTDGSSQSVEHGRELFESAGCGGCHALKAAGATGGVGPSLDGDPNLTKEFIIDRVSSGQGAMPPFGYQMSEQDIADIAAYVMQTAAK